jgi:signal transduction histidine kinase
LQAINRSSNYLNKLAEEFIIIRQVESEHYRLTKIPAAPLWLIEEIVELFRPHALNQGKQLTLHRQDIFPTYLNPTALKLILSNILENAIKYSGTGGRIEIHLAPTATGFEIRVEDDGPGIDPDDLELIFEKFYRSPKLADNLAGTGLGLYTSRTLATALGGSIKAHNRPEGGACFVVSLAT